MTPDDPLADDPFAANRFGDERLRATSWTRLAVWLGAMPLGLVVVNFALLLAGDAYRIFPVHPWINELYAAAGRGVTGDLAVMSLCSIPATAAGCAWLIWRGYGTGGAWRAAGVYAIVGGVWLLGCGVATVTAFRAIF